MALRVVLPRAGANSHKEIPEMKKLGFLMLLLTLAVMLGGTALAQDNSDYFVTYFSNANTTGAPDATVRAVNDGDTENNLYASISVFDDSEELTACCSCVITPDGLLSESVNTNLTANPLTHIKKTRGVIKIISYSTESDVRDRKSTRLNSRHRCISYAVF